jgi:hypothetical protein
MSVWGLNMTLRDPTPFPAPGVTIQGKWSSDCPTGGGVGALGSAAKWADTSTVVSGVAAIRVGVWGVVDRLIPAASHNTKGTAQ